MRWYNSLVLDFILKNLVSTTYLRNKTCPIVRFQLLPVLPTASSLSDLRTKTQRLLLNIYSLCTDPQRKVWVLAVSLSHWNLSASVQRYNQTKETFARYHKCNDLSLGTTTVSHGTFPGIAKWLCQGQMRQPKVLNEMCKTCRVKPLPLKCTQLFLF